MDSPSPTPSSSTYDTALSEPDDLANAMNLLALQNATTTTTTPSIISADRPPPATETFQPSSYGSSPSLNRTNSAPTVHQSQPKPSGTFRVVDQSTLTTGKAVKKRTAVIFQEACLNHKYTRNSDTAYIVERPERLRAIKTGVAAAWARLEQRDAHKYPDAQQQIDQLVAKLDISQSSTVRPITDGPFDVLFSDRIIDVDDPALTFVHPLPNLAPSDHAQPSSSSSTIDSKFETPNKEKANDTAADTSSNWPRQLQDLCRKASVNVQQGPSYSEIPAHLPQGDLYLAIDGRSEQAIFGAVGAVCEGVDRVVQGVKQDAEPGHDRAFVAIRPPGHVRVHYVCRIEVLLTGDAALLRVESDGLLFRLQRRNSGRSWYCFSLVIEHNANMTAAHLKHDIDRVVIVDIDLHHGNGTQEIAWRINNAANKVVNTLVSPKKGSPKKALRKRPLQIMYSSLHDIYSYPCEEGDTSFVQAASLNLTGGHSQWIANVHLQKWQSETEFHERLYHQYRTGLLDPADAFCRHSIHTADEPDPAKVLVILSAGFDASEHESAGMSRHAHNVPTSFYHRFARDVAKFANDHAEGKLVAVLEGGYSDRALCSGSMAMLVGLSEFPRPSEKTFLNESDENSWWSKESLEKIERALSPAAFANGLRSSHASRRAGEDPSWLTRARDIFTRIESSPRGNVTARNTTATKATPGSVVRNAATGAGMTLRERKSRTHLGASSTPSTPTRRSMAGKSSTGETRLLDATPQQSTLKSAPSTVTRSNAASTQFSGHPLRRAQSRDDSAEHEQIPPVPKLELPSDWTHVQSSSAAFRDAGADTDSESEQQSESSSKPTVKLTWRAGGIH